jgi:insertion element IS1 protein InsB
MTRRLAVEADAMASFVQTKAHTQWIGIAMDATTRPVMACHVGDRSRTSAKLLGAKMPDASHQHAPCDTDQYVVYARVIPTAQRDRHIGSENPSHRALQPHPATAGITLGT